MSKTKKTEEHCPGSLSKQLGTYEKLGAQLGSLVDQKNKEYGDSFNTAGDALKLAFPKGITPDQYSDVLNFVRNWDKWSRIFTGAADLEPCPHCGRGENPYQDIAGYALLGVERRRRSR